MSVLDDIYNVNPVPPIKATQAQPAQPVAPTIDANKIKPTVAQTLQENEIQVKQAQTQQPVAQPKPIIQAQPQQQAPVAQAQPVQPVQQPVVQGAQVVNSPIQPIQQTQQVPTFQDTVNPPTEQTAQQPAQQEQPTQQETPKDLTLSEIYEKLHPNPELTPEEKAKEERRERTKRAIAGISDAASALSNLFFTTKGAPSRQVTDTMTEATKKRYDEMLARRQANSDKWEAAMERYRNLDRQIGNDKATQAYHLAQFGENVRHNKTDEGIKEGSLAETISNNDTKNTLTKYKNETDAQYNKRMADIAAKNARTNASRVKENVRHDRVTEGQGQQKIGQGQQKIDNANANANIPKGSTMHYSQGKKVIIPNNVYKEGYRQIFDQLIKEDAYHEANKTLGNNRTLGENTSPAQFKKYFADKQSSLRSAFKSDAAMRTYVEKNWGRSAQTIKLMNKLAGKSEGEANQHARLAGFGNFKIK
jgi:hypothetical protein